jgi:hypothetical protein
MSALLITMTLVAVSERASGAAEPRARMRSPVARLDGEIVTALDKSLAPGATWRNCVAESNEITIPVPPSVVTVMRFDSRSMVWMTPIERMDWLGGGLDIVPCDCGMRMQERKKVKMFMTQIISVNLKIN